MCPHHELPGFLIINHLWTFQYFGGMEVMLRIILYGRKHNALEFPIQQIRGRVTTDTGYIRTIALPSSPVGKDCLSFLVLAIPIVSAVMIEDTATVGIHRISLRIVPDLSRNNIFIFLCLRIDGA